MNTASTDEIWSWLAEVPDPEVPVVSVVDLGMIRDVVVRGNVVEIAVAPTYSGCPATEVIEQDIASHLRGKGMQDVKIRRVLSPPWTTDWITDEGRRKLHAYGIAPPQGSAGKPRLVGSAMPIACPRCASSNTTLISEFGSTACKASYKCCDCLEPFEYFKCL
jgi:ring-1,2-phenylacetyl-CoA epoxidase subunit PaaD